MPKAYSCDLRERVITAVETGASRREAAERFEVSVASAVKWLSWYQQRSAAPKPRGGSVSPDLIAQRPDLTLVETVAELRKRRIKTSRRARHVEAGILLSSPLVFLASKQIGELALAKRLPLISLFAEFPKSGGLIAYGPNVGEIFRRNGDYVAKILHGAKPSELPIQRPERFDLVINLKTATALGLDVPTQLQQLADEVIE